MSESGFIWRSARSARGTGWREKETSPSLLFTSGSRRQRPRRITIHPPAGRQDVGGRVHGESGGGLLSSASGRLHRLHLFQVAELWRCCLTRFSEIKSVFSLNEVKSVEEKLTSSSECGPNIQAAVEWEKESILTVFRRWHESNDVIIYLLKVLLSLECVLHPLIVVGVLF